MEVCSIFYWNCFERNYLIKQAQKTISSLSLCIIPFLRYRYERHSTILLFRRGFRVCDSHSWWPILVVLNRSAYVVLFPIRYWDHLIIQKAYVTYCFHISTYSNACLLNLPISGSQGYTNLRVTSTMHDEARYKITSLSICRLHSHFVQMVSSASMRRYKVNLRVLWKEQLTVNLYLHVLDSRAEMVIYSSTGCLFGRISGTNPYAGFQTGIFLAMAEPALWWCTSSMMLKKCFW